MLVLVALLLVLRDPGDVLLERRDVDGSLPIRRTVEYGCLARRDVRDVVACDEEWSPPEEYLEFALVLELAVRLDAEREVDVAVRLVFIVREVPAFRVDADVSPLALRVLEVIPRTLR